MLTFPPDDRPLSDEGRAFLARQQRFRDNQGGYAHQQGTYPQTLPYGLNDSPPGLAAWIVDKFRAWSDCDGDVERRFSKDELLAIITLYWVTGSINSSFLFYYDSRHDPDPPQAVHVEAPVGVALFPRENPVTGPRAWAEQSYTITRWTQMPRGGHFPAAEDPSYSPPNSASSSAHSGRPQPRPPPAPHAERAGVRRYFGLARGADPC